jgi:carboxymethylenebutenolidase
MGVSDGKADDNRDVKDSASVVAKCWNAGGRVAVLGYCLGGLMTFLTVVRYGVDAEVVYHGGDAEKYLGEIDGLNAPLPMHLAEEDEFISKPAEAEIKPALAGKTKRDGLLLSGSASRVRSA